MRKIDLSGRQVMMHHLSKHRIHCGFVITAAMILAMLLVLTTTGTTVFAQDGTGQNTVYRIGVVPQFDQRKLFRI
jgi:hypothetical protein